jgi:hypothetical protein
LLPYLYGDKDLKSGDNPNEKAEKLDLLPIIAALGNSEANISSLCCVPRPTQQMVVSEFDFGSSEARRCSESNFPPPRCTPYRGGLLFLMR